MSDSVEQEKAEAIEIKELADKLYYFDLGKKSPEDRLNLASFICEHGYRLSTLPSQELLLTDEEIGVILKKNHTIAFRPLMLAINEIKKAQLAKVMGRGK